MLTEEIWRGCVVFSSDQFEDESTSVNIGMASIGSAAVGLRAVLDLKSFIPGSAISAITILANNPATEQALNGTV